MPNSRAPQVYISHNQNDKDIVHRLAEQLSKDGIDAYFDTNLIKDGGQWQEALTKGMMRSDVIVVLISPNSINSGYVMSELGMARTFAAKGEKLLLPVIYGGIAIPDFVKDIQSIIWDDEKNVTERIERAAYDFVHGNYNQSSSYAQTATTTKKPDQNELNLNKPPIHIINNYWLVKLKPETWKIDEFEEGEGTFLNTYYFDKERPEFQLFKTVRKGDKVLGFGAGNYQSIVCEMEVIKPVGPDTKQGEGFEMEIRELVDPRIPLKNFSGFIPDIVTRLADSKEPPELFFKISEEQYKSIKNSQGITDTPYVNLYQPFYVTEGNHQVTTDQLDFENDINSFASVITLEKVTPPLAIGLFGNWGSGKSFFMEKLSERIESIAKSKQPDCIENVVQVKFNSWHYSDANLWASLITQIFESLHDFATKKQVGTEAIQAIYKDLNITGQQLQETQSKIDETTIRADVLQEQKTNVEETIRVKKEKLSMWSAGDMAKIVFSDSYIQQDFENIKNQFGEEKLIDNIQQVDEKLNEVDNVVGQLTESVALLRKNKKGNWKWIWILALIFAILVYLILGPFKDKINHFINSGIVASGFIVAWMTNLISKLAPFFNKVNQFYKRLKSLKKTIDTEKENAKLKENDEVTRLNREINQLASERAGLEQQQKLIQERKAKLENELREIGSGRLLGDFLASRSADDSYIKQLGIISWIRKDFSKLNDLFKKQITVGAIEKLPVEIRIDRIVLYIDDLDRCNEEVVVKVLEAIHLLLAFPLFVVIVGVDPRWLNNALSEKYKNLFGNSDIKGQKTDPDPVNIEDDIKAATSYDYLEKIFQIPFALKPITKTGREKLIKYLIRDELIVTKVGSVDIGSPAVNPQVNDVGTGQPIKTQAGVTNETAGQQISAAKAKERLVFTNEELLYMQQISALYGQTPRTINRYVNIYRIIKAHGSLKVTGGFSKEDFMPLMFMLGVVVGYSSFAEKFIEAVSAADDAKEFDDFIKNSLTDQEFTKILQSLSVGVGKLKMKDFKKNVELISRFSFRTLLN